MNVADALRTYERVKRARKQELCGSLEGGPDAYNYLPERCVKRSKRTGKKRQNSTLRAEQIPVTTPESPGGLSKRSLAKLKVLVDRMDSKIVDKEADTFQKRAAALSSDPESPLTGMINSLNEPLLKQIIELPGFMAYACFKFTEKQFIAEFPAHEDRWKELNRIWPGKCKFTSDLRAKYSVMAFALKVFDLKYRQNLDIQLI